MMDNVEVEDFVAIGIVLTDVQQLTVMENLVQTESVKNVEMMPIVKQDLHVKAINVLINVEFLIPVQMEMFVH
jgi:hypothetical protein